MSIGTTAGLVAAGIGAAGAIGGSLIQSNAAGNAEKTQQTEANASLTEQQREFNINQANEAPWLQAGQGALSQLSAGTAPGGAFVQPYGQTFNPGAFQAPTGITEQNDPGYQARLQLGQQALEETAAAQGTQGGGQLQAAENYGQNFASNEYGNVYNRALNTYNANYQSGLGAFDTNYNVFENNQANQFNRLSSLAGNGQTAASNLGQLGQENANAITGINTNLGNQVSNLQTGQGAVLGAGLGGAAVSATGAINSAQNYQLLQQILSQQSANNSGYGGGGGSYNVPAPPGYDASGSYGEAGAE